MLSVRECAPAAASNPAAWSHDERVRATNSAIFTLKPQQQAAQGLGDLQEVLGLFGEQMAATQTPFMAQYLQHLQHKLAKEPEAGETFALEAERLSLHSQLQRLRMQAAINQGHACMLQSLVRQARKDLEATQAQLQQLKRGISAGTATTAASGEDSVHERMVSYLNRTMGHVASHVQVTTANPPGMAHAMPALELMSGMSSVAQLTAALQQDRKQLELSRCNTAASHHTVVQQLVRLRAVHQQQVLMSLRLRQQQTRPGSLDLTADPTRERDAMHILASPEVFALYKGMAALLHPSLA